MGDIEEVKEEPSKIGESLEGFSKCGGTGGNTDVPTKGLFGQTNTLVLSLLV